MYNTVAEAFWLLLFQTPVQIQYQFYGSVSNRMYSHRNSGMMYGTHILIQLFLRDQQHPAIPRIIRIVPSHICGPRSK